jgi:3-oxoacyl-[acyl-carrier protein] reductase
MSPILQNNRTPLTYKFKWLLKFIFILNLNGRTAVVFGGNGTIGSNLIKNLFLHNIDKVYTSFHKKNDKILNLKKTFGSKLISSKIDARDHKSVQSFVNEINKIDVGINCIGIIEDHHIANLTIESWENVINTNLTGTFNISKSLFNKMKVAKKGKIINISSIVGIHGAYGQSNYAASKAGIIGFTKSMALEGAKYNILVNCVVPGYIKSSMTKKIPANYLHSIINKIPLNRLGTADDVSKTIVFLVSDYSNYITGEIINVDGGLN